MKNLIIFSGKGGVGKTTAALSFCTYLKSQNQQSIYITFEEERPSYLEGLDVKHLNFSLWSSIESYLQKKFSSKIVTKLILKAPFFRALVKMVPGFKYVIFMGHLLDKVRKNPTIFYVLDAPASGHLITLFESFYTFTEIFKFGSIAKDLQENLSYWKEECPALIHLLALPQELPLQEAVELKETLLKDYGLTSSITMNATLSQVPGLSDETDLPGLIRQKIRNEDIFKQEYAALVKNTLPYSSQLDYPKMINELSAYAEQFRE